MKIRKKTATLAVIFAVCLMLSVFTLAADTAYDSTKDPIAAKSYVDAKVSELNATITSLRSEVTSLKTELTSLKSSFTSLKSDVTSLKLEITSLKTELEELHQELASIKDSVESGVSGATYTVVYVRRGETIYAKDGALELILRSGSAVAVSPFTTGSARQGLSDITKGMEIYNGESATVNDLLIIPNGNDGRGLKITSSDAYVMVRGNYEIK